MDAIATAPPAAAIPPRRRNPHNNRLSLHAGLCGLLLIAAGIMLFALVSQAWFARPMAGDGMDELRIAAILAIWLGMLEGLAGLTASLGDLAWPRPRAGLALGCGLAGVGILLCVMFEIVKHRLFGLCWPTLAAAALAGRLAWRVYHQRMGAGAALAAVWLAPGVLYMPFWLFVVGRRIDALTGAAGMTAQFFGPWSTPAGGLLHFPDAGAYFMPWVAIVLTGLAALQWILLPRLPQARHRARALLFSLPLPILWHLLACGQLLNCLD